ncbi:MAG: EF-hand domain-containing protein [Candidatus Thermoplasmatota archaeon]|nr:EF-hand domain-containing protein [Candidatus Thermoplasmatota archaeon]
MKTKLMTMFGIVTVLMFLAALPVALATTDREPVETDEPEENDDRGLSLREFHAFINGRMDDEAVKRIFNVADKDGDGQLSRREFAYAMTLVAKYIRSQNQKENNGPDKDGDGSISLREFNAFIEKKIDDTDVVKRIFNVADKDGDGQLSRREFAYAMTLVAKYIRSQKEDKDCGPDKDGDGSISLREFNAFIEKKIDDTDVVKRIFNAADKDGDGQLSRREFAYAMTLVAKYIRSQKEDKDCGPDKDGDGSISLREFNAFIEKKIDDTDVVKRIFNAADKDGDGQLSRREFAYAMTLVAKYIRGNASGDRDGMKDDNEGGDNARPEREAPPEKRPDPRPEIGNDDVTYEPEAELVEEEMTLDEVDTPAQEKGSSGLTTATMTAIAALILIAVLLGIASFATYRKIND